MKTPEEIEKLALDKFPTTINKYTEVNEKAIMRFGFIKGYNQCQQDNIDELNKVVAWWKEKCSQGFKDGYLKCLETNADKKFT
jgi:hypothetical protein